MRVNSSRHSLSGNTGFSRRFVSSVIAVAFVLSGGLLGFVAVRAEGFVVWTGEAGTPDWHTDTNWNPARVPDDGHIVIIRKGSVVECNYDTKAVMLQCEGDLIVSGGILNLANGSVLNGGRLTWAGGTIRGSGKLIVATDAQFVIEMKARQAVLGMAVENRGQVLVLKGDTTVHMNKGYTQTGTGTLIYEIGSDGVSVPLVVGKHETLALGGRLHVSSVDGYLPEEGKAFKLFQYGNDVERSGVFDEVTCSEVNKRFIAQYDFVYPGVVVNVKVVPEDSTAAFWESEINLRAAAGSAKAPFSVGK